MAKFIAPTTDPLPGQFLPKRGKRRSWEKGIVWNPRKQSLHIQKIADIEKDPDTAYTSCELPSAPNCVNIFLDSKTESEAFVLNSLGDKDKIFIGRLNLQGLSFFSRISRLCGNLSMLYIVRNASGESDNGD